MPKKGQNVKNMSENMNEIKNENPQTAARLTALLAVLYSVAMTPLKAAAKVVGLTMKNPDNGRKNATTTAQFRTAVDRVLTLWDAEVAFKAPILPALNGFGLRMWQPDEDSNRDTARILCRFALSPRGVGFAGLVGVKGNYKMTLRQSAIQTVDYIRASWADASNRCTATVDERKENSVGELWDGLRYCCQTCLRWFKNAGDVKGSIGPMCCGNHSVPANRYGEQSSRYEPYVRLFGLVKGKWSLRRFSFGTLDGVPGEHIEANPYYGNHLIVDSLGGATFFRHFGKQRKKFRIMAAMMEDVNGDSWRVWVGVPVILNASGAWVIDHIGAGMSKADALKMERTHALFANRDGFTDALISEINRRGAKAYTNKPQGSEASERLALRKLE